jgi:hypothetical protein
LNDRKVTRDDRHAGSLSPRKGIGEKTRFFGMFKKKKTEQVIEVGVVDGAGMTERDLFKGELRDAFLLDWISH